MTLTEYYWNIGHYATAIEYFHTEEEVIRQLKLFELTSPFPALQKAWKEQDVLGVFSCASQINQACKPLSFTRLGLLTESLAFAFRPLKASRRVFQEQEELMRAVENAYYMTVQHISDIE